MILLKIAKRENFFISASRRCNQALGHLALTPALIRFNLENGFKLFKFNSRKHFL
jgi:hypothetical protein